MSLPLADIKRAKVQSFRDVADALDGMAGANRDMKRGVERLPIMGDGWKGVSGEAAHHDLDAHGKYLDGHAQAQQSAAAKIRAAADEFEGVQQLLKKIENDAAQGKFTINYDTGEVTPPSGKYDKNELDYLTNTLRQISAAGGIANADLEAAVKAAQTLPDPSGAAAQGLPAMPGSAIKPGGVAAGLEHLAAPDPNADPGATKAAAAGTDTQANYKEWYPKTPGSGDKLTIDPSKAGSLTGTVGALEKLPGAPKPADGFGSGVARQFGQGVNSRVDGIIDEAKNLTGQGGPGSPGVAESWAKFALGTADQMANPLGSLPGEVKDAVNDPAGFAGKKLFDVSSIAATGPLGGEAAAGARGLLGDLTGAETRALTHGLDDAAPGHHTPPTVDHPAPNATLEHQSPNPGSWNHSTEHYSPHAPQLAADLNNAFTNGHPTSDLAAQVADHSTHHAPGIGSNANPDRVVLGKWDGQDGGYIGEARHNGGIYFDTGSDTWNAVGHGLDEVRSKELGWQVNEQFLRTQLENKVSRVDYVLPDGFNSVEQVARQRRESFSALEINFLKEHGAAYGYKQYGNSWVYEGGR
ncbi:endonuclease [Mycobacteroides abscessus]|uniref:endonuclease n=1 Tax=Mycobacteroides abscessus TaxID=36809 RepID=UPI000E678416|nr:endonuclease [Mycobacteroides abscessus]RIR60049.1 endonuclease [Mycobacteroides abscessus]